MLQMLFRLYPIICLARNSGGADCPCPVLLCFFINHEHYVQALLEEDELFYAVRNKSLPVNMIANQLPASTKENPSFHGYGLQNVHTTLEKYHTLYAMDYENGWFEFATELPNTLIS